MCSIQDIMCTVDMNKKPSQAQPPNQGKAHSKIHHKSIARTQTHCPNLALVLHRALSRPGLKPVWCSIVRACTGVKCGHGRRNVDLPGKALANMRNKGIPTCNLHMRSHNIACGQRVHHADPLLALPLGSTCAVSPCTSMRPHARP